MPCKHSLCNTCQWLFEGIFIYGFNIWAEGSAFIRCTDDADGSERLPAEVIFVRVSIAKVAVQRGNARRHLRRPNTWETLSIQIF